MRFLVFWEPAGFLDVRLPFPEPSCFSTHSRVYGCTLTALWVIYLVIAICCRWPWWASPYAWLLCADWAYLWWIQTAVMWRVILSVRTFVPQPFLFRVTFILVFAHFRTFAEFLWLKSLTFLDIVEDLIIVELLLNGSGSRSWKASSGLLRSNAVGVTVALYAHRSLLGTSLCTYVIVVLRSDFLDLNSYFSKLPAALDASLAKVSTTELLQSSDITTGNLMGDLNSAHVAFLLLALVCESLEVSPLKKTAGLPLFSLLLFQAL